MFAIEPFVLQGRKNRLAIEPFVLQRRKNGFAIKFVCFAKEEEPVGD